MRVKSVMTKDVYVVKVPGNRHELLKHFRKHNVSGMPVVRKDNGKLAGLVTSKDLFRKSHERQIALIMNKNPITCSPNTDLKRAIKLMVDNYIHRLIVQKDGFVKGILTPHDILPLVIKKKIDRPVIQAVYKRCAPVYKETPLHIAWRVLKISQSYALPVINENGQIVGIITDRDFFGIGKVGHRTETSTIGVGEDEDVWTWESLKNVMKVYYEVSDIDLPKRPVKHYMMKDPTSVFIKTPAYKAAEKMYKNDFRILPIIDSKENLVNMVSDLNIIALLQ